MQNNNFRIFVFANLKPSQINYKIIPLSRSSLVEHVYILRKTPLKLYEDKITCLNLPWILRQRPIYWIITAIYGVFLIKKYKTNLILNYNIFPHGFNAYLASKITRQQVIFSEINEDTMKYYQQKTSRFLIKNILKNASVICTPGKYTSSFWNNQGFDRTTLLHSTIDTKKFKPDITQKKTYDFIYIGEFDDNKRPDLILEAFYQIHTVIPSSTLCMIGYGKMEKFLKDQIDLLKLGSVVTLLKSNDALTYLQQSKVLVLASLSEGLPCVIMEAMACELLVVVPPVGNITDIVKHGVNGFLHDNSKNGLVKCMFDAIINFENYNSNRAVARETIMNEHSYEVATDKWDHLLPLMIESGDI